MSEELDAEELAYLQAHAQAQAPARGQASELLIRRRPIEILIPVILWMLAAIVAAMGEVEIGAGLALVVLLGLVIHGRRRVARIRVAEDGTMALPGRLEPLDWSTLRAVRFRLRYPFMAERLRRIAEETAVIRLETGDGRRIKLARGPLWRLAPTRESLSWANFGRELERRARDAGMVVERPSKLEWHARRPR